MSQAHYAGSPRSRHLGTQYCEDVPGGAQTLPGAQFDNRSVAKWFVWVWPLLPRQGGGCSADPRNPRGAPT
eukprot:6625109-Pyramimonas_sp.AAC.1